MSKITLKSAKGGVIQIHTTHMEQADADALVDIISHAVTALDQHGPSDQFLTTSNYGHRTKLPFVAISLAAKNFAAQLWPNDARDLAHALLVAAEAAESDAMVIEYLSSRVQIKDERILASILLDLRDLREEIAARCAAADQDDEGE